MWYGTRKSLGEEACIHMVRRMILPLDREMKNHVRRQIEKLTVSERDKEIAKTNLYLLVK